MKSGVAAVIPALNEEAAISSVVSGLLSLGISPVVVVDNGSTDATSDFAKTAGATVVYEPKRGYGSACWTGIQQLPDACKWVLFCAGDGQDHPSEVPRLVQATDTASLVVGNRVGTHEGKNVLTKPQQWASTLGGWALWMGWGHFFSDIGGMRVVSRQALMEMELKDRGFGFFVEMQIRALTLGLPVSEVSIMYRSRGTGQTKISGTIKGSLIAAVILVATVVRLYLTEVWQIFTVPISERQFLAQSQHASQKTANEETQLESDIEVGSEIDSALEARSFLSLNNSASLDKHCYPGFPVLAGVQSSQEGNHMSISQTHQSPNFSLPATETTQWVKRASAKSSLIVLLAAVLQVYGVVLTSLYNDPKEENGSFFFCLGVALLSAGYFLFQALPCMSSRWFWSVTLLTRLASLMTEPSLGDDVYRFVWEGWIQNYGYNPYLYKPSSPELKSLQQSSHYMQRVYMGINHPDVTSVYPPLAQLAFRLFSLLANRAGFFKLFFVAADVCTCWLLNCHFGNKRGALYAWNPLVILASAGGGHFDSLMVLPLVMGWFSFERGRYALGALFVGVSVGLKWVTAPFIAFIIVAASEWRGFLHSLLGLGWDSMREQSSSRLFWFSIKTSAVAALFGIAPLVLSAMNFCSNAFCRLAPLNSEWMTHDRSADCLPRVLYFLVPQTRDIDNMWFVIMVVPLLAIVYWVMAGRPRTQRLVSFATFGELFFFMLLSLSPIVHFWYFNWGMPFVCETNNLGTRLVSMSALFSLLKYSRSSTGNLLWWEWLLMWGPYLLGWMYETIIYFKGRKSKAVKNLGFGLENDRPKSSGKGM